MPDAWDKKLAEMHQEGECGWVGCRMCYPILEQGDEMALCRGWRIDGERCSRTVSKPEEFCWQHKFFEAGIVPDKVTPVGNSVIVSKKLPTHIEEVKAHVYTCDSCFKTIIVLADEPDGPPLGYHGNVFYVSETHGNSCDFFICNECVQYADKIDEGITNALDKAWNS